MPFEKPLARTREYVGILRDIWARQGPVTSDGPHYALPLRDGPAVAGLGKTLKASIHALREHIPGLPSGRKARRTRRWPLTCATAGWRCCSARTSSSTPTRWRKGSPGPAPDAAQTTSRSRRWSRSSFTTTSRPRSTWCDRSTPCTSAAWVDGRQELPRQRGDSHGLGAPEHRDPGSLPRGQEGRGSRQDPLRPDPEDVAARTAGQDPPRRPGAAPPGRRESRQYRTATLGRPTSGRSRGCRADELGQS